MPVLYLLLQFNTLAVQNSYCNLSTTAHLTITERLEVLIPIGCKDETRTHHKVCGWFIGKYPANPESVNLKLNLDKLTICPKPWRLKVRKDEKLTQTIF